MAEQAERPPLSEHLATLKQLREQDLEPDPSDPSGRTQRIRQGVAKERRISIEEPEMRHGRKSKSRTINGYKAHLGVDLDTELVLACAVTPAIQGCTPIDLPGATRSWRSCFQHDFGALPRQGTCSPASSSGGARVG